MAKLRVVGGDLLVVGGALVVNDNCCCIDYTCDDLPSTLYMNVTVADECCAGATASSFTGWTSETKDTDGDGCCFWQWSAGSGDLIDCPGGGGTDEGAGLAFRLKFCPGTSTWTWNKYVTGGVEKDYCSPANDTAATLPTVVTGMGGTFDLTETALPLTGCCDSTADVYVYSPGP